jgi:toxin ParE1/3/4
MKRRIRIHRLVYQEMYEAADWYDRERPGSGARLLREVDGTIVRIIMAPQEGSPHLYGTRRFILDRFPYSTVYLTVDATGHLIAFAHHSRREGYWRKRLKDIH